MLQSAVPGRAASLAAATTALCLLFPAPAGSWGHKGHEIVNRLAAEAMPPETPKFFREAVERLEFLGPEPDRWRRSDAGTEVKALDQDAQPEHYIDLEYVSGFDFPRGRYDFLRALIEHGVVADKVKLETPGLLPYRITELCEMLRREWWWWQQAPEGTEAEREHKRQIEQDILYTAGVLGHYVGDGGQPLHTTWHFNGWVEEHEPNPEGFSTSRGLHYQFEDTFVDMHVEIGDARPLIAAQKPVKDFLEDTLAYLRASNAQVKDLYRLDKKSAFAADPNNPQPPTEANLEGKRFVAGRIAVSASMLRDLWTAAMQGGTAAATK
jgi:hypothetical protein